jgi:DNA-binding NarL/FixJ family response regulator
VRLLLIDDRVLYREAIRDICDTAFHFDVVGQFVTFEEAVPCFRWADVALVRDNLLPLWPEPGSVKLLVMADSPDIPGALECLRRGACGTVSSDTSPESLAVAIRHVAGGGVWFDQSTIRALAGKLTV